MWRSPLRSRASSARSPSERGDACPGHEERPSKALPVEPARRVLQAAAGGLPEAGLPMCLYQVACTLVNRLRVQDLLPFAESHGHVIIPFCWDGAAAGNVSRDSR